jgi:hypothetical protein
MNQFPGRWREEIFEEVMGGKYPPPGIFGDPRYHERRRISAIFSTMRRK